MTHTGHDTLKTRKTLTIDGEEYDYFSLPDAAHQLGNIDKLPFTLKILLEFCLLFERRMRVFHKLQRKNLKNLS